MDRPDRVGAWCLFLAGVGNFVGGSLHPIADATIPHDHATAESLAHGRWVPSHSIILVGLLFLIPAMVRLARVAGDRAVRVAARLVLAAAVIASVEMVWHTFAYRDADALLAGGETPILSTHLRLAVFAYPMMGIALSALAIAHARGRCRWHKALAAAGVIGSLSQGIAAPLVILQRNHGYTFLFVIGTLMSVWMLVAGFLWIRRRA